MAPGMEPIPPTTAAVKPFRPGHEAHQVVDLVEDEAHHHARRARERGADEEGRDDDAVDVDPLHRRRLTVERRRAHRLAEPRAGDEQGQREHQRERGQDDPDPNRRDVERAPVDAGRQVDVLVRLVARKSAPKRRSADCRKNETPSAVISGAIRGAFRSGR